MRGARIAGCQFSLGIPFLLEHSVNVIGLNGRTSAAVGHMDDISDISMRFDWFNIRLPMEGLFLGTSFSVLCELQG